MVMAGPALHTHARTHTRARAHRWTELLFSQTLDASMQPLSIQVVKRLHQDLDVLEVSIGPTKHKKVTKTYSIFFETTQHPPARQGLV